MEKRKETILLFCTIVGGVADICAISMLFQSWNVALAISVATMLLFLGIIVYLYTQYKERCDFLHFIEYLFENPVHNFNLLPKVCLALDKSKETNNLYIRKLCVSSTCDMRDIDMESLSPDSVITYPDVIEYNIRAENKNLPKEFVCYMGNMNSEENFAQISQKHGSQSEYETVPEPRYTDETETDSNVERYCWQLKKENMTGRSEFPISFRLKYVEQQKANSNDIIVIYPRQYAKRIEVIEFRVCFLCDKKILKDVAVYKVWKDHNNFKHTPISGVHIEHNTASIRIEPDSHKYEAYYVKTTWEMVGVR